jgi:predicted transcriptional regulator
VPARQRAVLILRDVLGWRAAEVAELLGTTTTAVNGMLQRARARLEQAAPDEDQIHEPADPADRALLDRYATAFQNADITAVMQLLRDDAVFEMPPEPAWFTGRELIGRFLQSQVLTEPGRFQMIPTAANDQRLAQLRASPQGRIAPVPGRSRPRRWSSVLSSLAPRTLRWPLPRRYPAHSRQQPQMRIWERRREPNSPARETQCRRRAGT